MSDNRDNPTPGLPLNFLTYQISSSATDENAVVDSGQALDIGEIPELCELLKETDVHRRQMAANALMQMGPAGNAAVPRLIELLKERQEPTRRCVLEILSSLGTAAEPAIPALRAALRDPVDLVCRWAALTLGEIGPAAKEATTDLLELRAHSNDQKTHAVALAALKKIDPQAGTSHALVKDEMAIGEICRFYSHSAWVNSVALSADDGWALSASGQPSDLPGEADFSIRLWDVEQRREQRRLLGHADRVTSVAFFPDGTHCLSGSFDATVRLWDLQQGRELRCFRGHADRVKCVAVSPDGQRILSCGCDRTLRFWDVQTGREVFHLANHQHWVVSVAFSPDGKYALSGSLDGTARLWDLNKGREVAGRGGGWLRGLWPGKPRHGGLNRAQGPRAAITSVAFHPHGTYAIWGSTDSTLSLFDLDSGKVVRQYLGHKAGVTSVACSADGRFLASGSTDHTLRWWDVNTGTELRCFEGHADVVTGVALSSDGRFALSGSADKTVRVWLLPNLMSGG
jgi:WD40 repeat protein